MERWHGEGAPSLLGHLAQERRGLCCSVQEVLSPVISRTLFAETQKASLALDIGSVEI